MKRSAPSPVKEKSQSHKKAALYDPQMEDNSSLPGSPTGGPLQSITPERVNQQRDSFFASLRSEGRDSCVHDKIHQFNNLSVSAQTKQLERKTADAALRRAMLGREEAETDVRRYKEEAKMMQKAVEEGKERERKVGERLETVMENYGRTKETHAHTKALWEKEIRRARKETFKTQSTIVKLQEELKTARTAVRILEDGLENEKDRSHVREQEAFTSRYQLVGVQEQFEQALAQIKVVEQERDAFKTAAKNEEIARMAAEGRIPLPSNETPDDEFATPKVKKQKKTGGFKLKEARVSLSSMDIVSSEASELEIEALDLQVQWEKQRADRAQEMIEFLQAECQMHVCACSKFMARSSAQVSHQEQPETVETLEDEPAEDVTMVNNDEPDPEVPEVPVEEVVIIEEQAVELSVPKSKKEARRSTIFFPQEGIFRTISEQDAAAAQAQLESEIEADIKEEEEPEEPEEPEEHDEPDAPVPPSPIEAETNLRTYARTPSVDPPAFALLSQERTSLLSLLNAPQSAAHTAPLPSMASIPTIPDEEAPAAKKSQAADAEDAGLRTSSSAFTVTTTVPLRGETLQASASFSEKLRTPSSASSSTTFDSTNPALTPTMTREEALAKIRERRGRAKSAAQGATTARKKMAQGSDRRDLSAPTAKAGPVKKKS